MIMMKILTVSQKLILQNLNNKKGNQQIMKKIIAFLMAFTMCVGFTSCGESSTERSEEEVTTETTTKEATKATTEPTTESLDLIAFYNNLKNLYYNSEKWLSVSENQITYTMPTDETISSFTPEELEISIAIGRKFMDFLEKHESELIIDTKEGVSYNTITARKK